MGWVDVRATNRADVRQGLPLAIGNADVNLGAQGGRTRMGSLWTDAVPRLAATSGAMEPLPAESDGYIGGGVGW
jgi:hypothetical protein